MGFTRRARFGCTAGALSARRRGSRPGADPDRHRPKQGSIGICGGWGPTAGPPFTDWMPPAFSGRRWRRPPLAPGFTGPGGQGRRANPRCCHSDWPPKNLPFVSRTSEAAVGHFGWMAHFIAADMPASSAYTRERFGWRPTQVRLIADLENGTYFKQALVARVDMSEGGVEPLSLSAPVLQILRRHRRICSMWIPRLMEGLLSGRAAQRPVVC